MELKDTIEFMNSSDYKERFIAEYLQLKIRISGLATMLEKYKNGKLNFTPTCSYNLLHSQLVFMDSYLETLEKRAKLEGIEL